MRLKNDDETEHGCCLGLFTRPYVVIRWCVLACARFSALHVKVKIVEDNAKIRQWEYDDDFEGQLQSVIIVVVEDNAKIRQWEYDDDFEGQLYSVIMAMGVR